MAKLDVGQPAPDFKITAVDGTTVNLSQLEGSHTLLAFFRYAGCPFCDLTLIKLVERYHNFSVRGLKVVAFFQSDKDSIIEYVATKKPPFPIVADPDKKIYDLYGVERSKAGAARSVLPGIGVAAAVAAGKTKQGKLIGDFFLMPAQFIVGPDLCIEKAHYGRDFSDKLPFIEIETILLTEVPHDHTEKAS